MDNENYNRIGEHVFDTKIDLNIGYIYLTKWNKVVLVYLVLNLPKMIILVNI